MVQLILPLNMNQLVLYNSKTIGRDKLARLIQYASKLTWHILQRCNANGASVSKIQELEYILSNFRKLLRMGRSLDTLYTALTLTKFDDAMISFNCAFSKVSYAIFLFCDHLIWFGRNGFANIDTIWWNRVSCKYWLLTITMNLVRDFLEIKKLLNNREIVLKYNLKDPKTAMKTWLSYAETHKDIVLDVVKNSCDLFLPLTSLDYVKLSPGTIGLLGVISSAVGIYTVIDPFAKLPMS